MTTVKNIIMAMERTICSITRDKPDQAGAIDIIIPNQTTEILNIIHHYFINQGWVVSTTPNPAVNNITFHLRWWAVLNGSKSSLSHFEAQAQAKATLRKTGVPPYLTVM